MVEAQGVLRGGSASSSGAPTGAIKGPGIIQAFAEARGCFVFGNAKDAVIQIGDGVNNPYYGSKGCVAFGNAYGKSASVSSKILSGVFIYENSTSYAAKGCFTFGNAYGGQNKISTYRSGSFAGGNTESAGFDIIAKNNGSFAFGSADTASILASATNAVQFGPGTNNTALSLQVGAAGVGPRLDAVGTINTLNIITAGCQGPTAGNIVMAATDMIAISDAAAANRIIELPPAATGRIIMVRHKGGGGFSTTVVPDSITASDIDGANSLILNDTGGTSPGAGATLVCDGTNWWTVGISDH